MSVCQDVVESRCQAGGGDVNGKLPREISASPWLCPAGPIKDTYHQESQKCILQCEHCKQESWWMLQCILRQRRYCSANTLTGVNVAIAVQTCSQCKIKTSAGLFRPTVLTAATVTSSAGIRRLFQTPFSIVPLISRYFSLSLN